MQRRGEPLSRGFSVAVVLAVAAAVPVIACCVPSATNTEAVINEGAAGDGKVAVSVLTDWAAQLEARRNAGSSRGSKFTMSET